MKYAELAEETRMSMSREEVEEYIKVELMERGTKPAENPGEFSMKAPVLKKQTVYRIPLGSGNEAHFRTFELAKKFLDCKPMTIDYDYDIGRQYSWAVPLENPTIEPVEVYLKDEVMEHSADVINYSKASKRHSEAKGAYDYYLGRRASITASILGDWDELQAKAAEQRQIRQTFEEYLVMANQDETIARTFLAKAYGEQKVNEVLGAVTTECQEETQEGATA